MRAWLLLVSLIGFLVSPAVTFGQTCSCPAPTASSHQIIIDSPNRVAGEVRLGTSDFWGGQLIACFYNEFGEWELAFLRDAQAGYVTSLVANSFYCSASGTNGVSVVGSDWGSGSGACGSSDPWNRYQPFEQNGYRLDLYGSSSSEQFSIDHGTSCSATHRVSACSGGGDDQISNMTTWVQGGGGNDAIIASCGGTIMWGGSGRDHITNTSAVNSVTIYGDSGRDCVAPYSVPRSQIKCGPDADDFFARGYSGTLPVDCEAYTSRECALGIRDIW